MPAQKPSQLKWFFLSGLFLFNQVFAQKLNYRIDHYGTEKGLSQGSVLAMLKDSRGMMWFGTQDGLNRWDGESFTVFRPSQKKSNSIDGIEIKKIIEDENGDLWIGTESALNYYSYASNNFRKYTITDKEGIVAKSEVFPIKAVNGMVWYWSALEGLVKLNVRNGRKQIILPNQSFKTSYFRTVNSTQFDSQGKLWIHSSDAIIRLDTIANKKDNIEYFFSNHPQNKAGKLLEIIKILPVDNILWIATAEGLVRFDYTSNEIKLISEFEKGKAIDVVFDLDTDGKGNLWLGTEKNGLLRYSIANQTFAQIKNEGFLDKNNLYINEISQVYVDYDGIIWANTDPYGIDRIQILPNNLSSFRIPFPKDFPKQLLNYSVRFIIKDEKKQQLLLATQQSGIWILNDKDLSVVKSFYNDNNQNPLPSNTVRYLKKDSSDNLWIGTSQGLALMKGDNIQKLNNTSGADAVLSNFIRCIEEDKESMIIGTEGGIYFINKQTRQFQRKVLLPNKRISLLKKIGDGKYFVGIYNEGLWQLESKDNFEHFTTTKIIREGIPICAQLSKDHSTWWIGTSKGLVKYSLKNKTTETLTTEDGLPNNFIYACEIDKNNNLWVSTNRGIARFDTKQQRFIAFNLNDGLQAYEFNGYSSFQTSDGELFFGGVNGFNRFYPGNITKSIFTPNFNLIKEENQLFVGNRCMAFTDINNQYSRPLLEDETFMSRFKPTSNDIPNFGYSDKTVWLMMRVMNLADRQWLMEIANSRINEIDLFVVENNRIINSKKLGDHYPYHLNTIKDANPIFKIDMIENQEYIIFLKCKSTEDLKFPIYFWQESDLFQAMSNRKIIWGIYFGFIFLIVLYNFFLWLVIRERSLVYYILYVLCFGGLQAVLYGFFYQYIWSNSWLNDRGHLLFLNVSSFFMIYFTIEFLNLGVNLPHLVKSIKWFSYIILLFNCSLLVHYEWYSNFISIGLTFILLVIQGYVVYNYVSRNIRIIWLYALAMVSISMAAIIVALKNLNVISAMNQEYFLMVGSMLEIVLFSVAFGDKLRRSQKDQQGQQMLRNEISTTLHDDLAASLSSLTMFSELNRMKFKKSIPETSEIFNKISTRSREMMRQVREAVYDMSPQNDDSAEWIDRMVQFAKEMLSSKQIELNLNIDENIHVLPLSTQQRRNLYLFFKEAINNIAKHSEASEVKIDFRLITSTFEKHGKLVITDNGKGFDTKDLHQGNGLLNFQKRAETLGGKVEVCSEIGKGTKIELNFVLR
jgi:signal transduction histidine kinase/ligand-binding sensor domain-containing protein